VGSVRGVSPWQSVGSDPVNGLHLVPVWLSLRNGEAVEG
jgi:hypothetical protein